MALLLGSFLACLFLFAFSLPAQRSELDLASLPALLENKHVRAARLAIPSHATLVVHRLAFESLLIAPASSHLQFVQRGYPPQRWEPLPGDVFWVRGNLDFSVENSGNSPADLISLELRDSYAFDQLSAPRSSLDPPALDPRHFRSVLDNEHVRALLLHFGAREESPEAQFIRGIQISLSDAHFTRISQDGEHHPDSSEAGSVSVHPTGIYSLHNLDAEPFDSLYIELKHPFCLGSVAGTSNAETDSLESPQVAPVASAYIYSVEDRVGTYWRKHMPSPARNEERGLVGILWKIKSDGSIREEDMMVSDSFASDVLIAAARNAVRKSAPFSAIPPGIDKPELLVRFIFLYNIPHMPPACE